MLKLLSTEDSTRAANEYFSKEKKKVSTTVFYHLLKIARRNMLKLDHRKEWQKCKLSYEDSSINTNCFVLSSEDGTYKH